MTDQYYETLADMENDFYGWANDLMKSDAPILTTTTGVRNAIFGQKIWEQIVLEANAFGILPKKPWDKSGYRAATAAAATSGGGISEGGNIPEEIKSTFKEITVEPKDVAIAFGMSARQMSLADRDDVVQWAEHQQLSGDTYANLINRQLLTDNDTLASNNLESIDRVIGSNSEIAGVGQTAGDLDIYGIDRDATSSWADAYVGHTSGVDRTLTLGLIDDIITNVRPNWGNPAGTENKVFLTGYDTKERWDQLLEPQQRYDNKIRAKITKNGIETIGDQEAGFNVSSYKGIPIFATANMPQDTISRIYLLDLDKLWISIAKPTVYLESEEYLHIGKYRKKGSFYSIMELTCTRFNAQGKLRDLK